jgi:hypothetical protein
MPLFVVAVAVFNLMLGFALAVYLGAAPRFASLLRAGHKEPSPLIRRIMSFLPKRKSAPLS